MFQQWSNLLNLIIWDTKNTNGSFTRIAIDFYKHNTKQKLKTSMYFFPVYNRMVMKVDESWRLLSLYPKAWFRGSQFFNFSCILWGRIWQNFVYPEFFFFFSCLPWEWIVKIFWLLPPVVFSHAFHLCIFLVFCFSYKKWLLLSSLLPVAVFHSIIWSLFQIYPF